MGARPDAAADAEPLVCPAAGGEDAAIRTGAPGGLLDDPSHNLASLAPARAQNSAPAAGAQPFNVPQPQAVALSPNAAAAAPAAGHSGLVPPTQSGGGLAATAAGGTASPGGSGAGGAFVLGVAAGNVLNTALAGIGVPTATPHAQGGNPKFTQINTDGFGDWQNSYAWSMAWFEGKLYVGTNRYSDLQVLAEESPLIAQLEDFHHVSGSGAAQIWCYTPATGTWAMVYESPEDIPIPGEPGTFAAPDNGFRSMAVFTEANGTQALYVGGVVYSGTAPGVQLQARILRTTDGIHFTAVPQDPGTFLGDLDADSMRSMTVYQGNLYLVAGSTLGPGVVIESSDPAAGDNAFKQVSPSNVSAFEMEVFNNQLYVGAVEPAIGVGYTVYKMGPTIAGNPYATFIPVVTDGGYYGPITSLRPQSVLSMDVFDGALYVGSQTNLIRIEPNDTWQLIVGNPRPSPGGEMYPASGLGNGFNNPYVAHLWRMVVFDNTLYVGTWDISTFLAPLPIIGPSASAQAGFDLWSSSDGVHWAEITSNGFGDPYNIGVRSLVATPVGLFLGTVNPWQGTQIWLAT